MHSVLAFSLDSDQAVSRSELRATVMPQPPELTIQAASDRHLLGLQGLELAVLALQGPRYLGWLDRVRVLLHTDLQPFVLQLKQTSAEIP